MSKSKWETFNKLQEIESKIDQLLDGGGNAKAIQVELLHQYNDIKDATQIVIDHIANTEGITVTEIHKRLKLD